MKKILSFICLTALATFSMHAQTKKTGTNPAQAQGGYKTTPNGLQYKILKQGTGRKPVSGDFIGAHLSYKINDSLLFSTRQVNENKPAEIQMPPTFVKGEILEAFLYMNEGDSATLRIPIDSLLAMGAQPAPWMKAGANQMLNYYIVLASVKSADQKKKEDELAFAAQGGIDDKKLQEYFAANKIKATKTASGLYYKIDKQGTGNLPNIGDTVSANYTGMTLQGTKFDSNVDPQFQHVQPFMFPVGMSMVIRGWDEGFQLFKKGAKGTLYIPSSLAYGARGQGPVIKANEILVFDVELVDVKPAKK